MASNAVVPFTACIAAAAVGSLFENWVWRGAVMSAASALATLAPGGVAGGWWTRIGLAASVICAPSFSGFGNRWRKQPERGAVLITGCGNGMGEALAIALCNRPYELVFAGCRRPESCEQLLEKVRAAHGAEAAAKLVPLSLDVTSDESMASAAEVIRMKCEQMKIGLVGVFTPAAVAYTGPAEYVPLELLRRQLEVNFFGQVRTYQACLPLLKEQACSPGGRRGRFVFFGTGGGACSPTPPLISAYMASKFAMEAFAGCARMENKLRGLPIDLSVCNPGFVKPTGLEANGLQLQTDMWNSCQKALGSNVAAEEYESMVQDFTDFSAKQPATHVSVFVAAMVTCMTSARPLSSYKVGVDSKVAPIVGCLPTGIRETIVLSSMYGRLGSAW